jgi:antitoxin HigA-1
MPMKNPPHPGDLIRTEIIEELGLSVSKAAKLLKVRRATLSDLLHGKAALTPEMELAYDVAKTRAHASRIDVKRYVPA